MRRKPRARARTLLKEGISTEPYTLTNPFTGAPLTFPAGQKQWIETVGLRRGDKLHDGKHAGLTNEHHWALIEACGIVDGTAHFALIMAIRDIEEQYTAFGGFEKDNDRFAEHRQRLARIAALAKKLRPLVIAEPLIPFMLLKLVKAHATISEQLEIAEWLQHSMAVTLGEIAVWSFKEVRLGFS